MKNRGINYFMAWWRAKGHALTLNQFVKTLWRNFRDEIVWRRHGTDIIASGVKEQLMK